MGVFHIDCDVLRIGRKARPERVRRALVDTGSELSWIPADILRRAGIQISKRDQPFVMANGQTITRHIGYAMLRASGFETVDEVVFAQPGDLALLGARTLEGFGVRVDPRRHRLVGSGPAPAAPGDAR